MSVSATMRKWSGLVSVVFVLAASSAFLLYHLGNEPLQDYDEATYAEVVHDAMANGNYLSFTDGGGNYFKKPPLAFWAMAVSESALGENTFAMRLPFALSGIVVIAVLMLLLYEVSESWWAAALGGAVLATTAPFMETARQVRLDVMVVLCIVLAVYFFMRGLKDSRWLLAFGAMIGLAILAKSVIAAFAVVAAVFAMLFYRRLDLFKNKYAYGSIAVALLVAAPWHLWEWAHFGNAFWAQYIGVEVLSRTKMNLFWTVSLTNADYMQYLLQFTQPWIVVFFVSLVATLTAWKWLPQQSRRFVLVSILTIAVMVAVFFTAKTKAPTYLMPMYPFAAAVIALSIVALTKRIQNPGFRAVSAAVVIVLVCGGVYSTYYNAYHHNPYYSIELHMAQDEKQIAAQLLVLPPNVPVYVYDDENLGSIEYESRHLSLLPLTATSTAPTIGYVIVDTDGLGSFSKMFPSVIPDLTYSGPQVSLIQVRS
jgi:4-amino-4-deoxy-L-arabinose transferase-like glycosyltransferase